MSRICARLRMQLARYRVNERETRAENKYDYTYTVYDGGNFRCSMYLTACRILLKIENGAHSVFADSRIFSYRRFFNLGDRYNKPYFTRPFNVAAQVDDVYIS